MDSLGDLLAPYSDSIAKFAGAVTCLQFLSGVFLLNDIRKRGCSDTYPAEPFLGGLVLTVLSLKLGSIMGDTAMINVNVIGFAINIVFLSIFYWYASSANKSRIWSKIGFTSVFLTGCLAYSSFEDPEKLEFRLGMIITMILVILVGSPLLNLGQIIQKQSTEGLPFPIILAGTIVAASWALYGISIRNEILAYQNLFLLILSSIQLSLFVIYPNTSNVQQRGVASTQSNISYKSNQSTTNRSRVKSD